MTLKLDSLIPTHNELRNPNKLPELVESFSVENLLKKYKVPIMRIEQPRFGEPYHMHFIRDKHHALTAYYHFKVTNLLPLVLFDDEYTIEEFTFTDIWTANVDVGWVTPFNPVTHVRKPDFFKYKEAILKSYKASNNQDINTLIKESFENYAEPRTVLTLKDLYLKYRGSINEKNTVGINAH